MIQRECQYCSGIFYRSPSRIKRGDGTYCCKSCRDKGLKKSDADAFWPSVNKTETCWLWTAGKTPDGYGQVRAGRRAHRLSWTMHFGPIPQGMMVCHRCDTPLCVNPDHLFVGTAADNNRDMMKKGRHRAPRKLTPEQIEEIRLLGDLPRVVVAEKYGVTPVRIRQIVRTTLVV